MSEPALRRRGDPSGFRTAAQTAPRLILSNQHSRFSRPATRNTSGGPPFNCGFVARAWEPMAGSPRTRSSGGDQAAAHFLILALNITSFQALSRNIELFHLMVTKLNKTVIGHNNQTKRAADRMTVERSAQVAGRTIRRNDTIPLEVPPFEGAISSPYFLQSTRHPHASRRSAPVAKRAIDGGTRP